MSPGFAENTVGDSKSTLRKKIQLGMFSKQKSISNVRRCASGRRRHCYGISLRHFDFSASHRVCRRATVDS